MATGEKAIVVVNDDRAVLEVIREVLEEGRYRVLVADDAERGFRLVRETLPDLAIVDVRLPGGPDWRLLDLLKRDPRTAAVPVLVCSASAQEMREAEPRLRADDCDFLAMPFDIDELLAKADRLTG